MEEVEQLDAEVCDKHGKTALVTISAGWRKRLWWEVGRVRKR